MKTLKSMVLAALFCAHFSIHAESARPIKVVVPYGAGGIVDAVTRVMTTKMAEILGRPLIIENRIGANANIGANLVAQAPADGLTLLATSSFLITNPLVEENLSWSPQQFTPIARFGMAPSGITVGAGSPYTTLEELLAGAKTNSLTSAQAGIGTAQNMVRTLVGDLSGVTFRPVPYAAGGTSYVTDLVNGRIDFGVIPLNVALGLVKGGRARVLATTAPARLAELPSVPTMQELGLGEASVNTWVGLHAPAGTSPALIKRLVDAARIAAQDPGVRARLASAGAESAFQDSAEFQAFLNHDLIRARRFAELWFSGQKRTAQ